MPTSAVQFFDLSLYVSMTSVPDLRSQNMNECWGSQAWKSELAKKAELYALTCHVSFRLLSDDMDRDSLLYFVYCTIMHLKIYLIKYIQLRKNWSGEIHKIAGCSSIISLFFISDDTSRTCQKNINCGCFHIRCFTQTSARTRKNKHYIAP